MTNKFTGTKIYYQVYAELIQAARYRGYITYQEVAQMAGLPLSGNYMGAEVGQLLGAISFEEHQQGRPMLSAIAVSSSGMPGEGFFGLAKELGYQFEDSKKGIRAFWEAEKKKVYEIWQLDLKK